MTWATAPLLATPPSDFRLRDVRRELVRPILPEDRERLRSEVHELSAASRYHRFHAAVSELSGEQLRDLTEIDQVNHLVWVALDPAIPGEPAVGVARLPENPAVAEVAVPVLDAYQGRGLGTVLLVFLGQSAAAQGIRSFRAYVLQDNEAMLRIVRDLGAHVERLDLGVYQLDIPVPEDPETLPDTPAGRVFKAVAVQVGQGRSTSA